MPNGDHPPRRFDFGQPAVVQQAFTFDGRDYKTGDTFPYEQLGLDKTRMHGFWCASFIDFRAPEIAKPGKRR